MYNWTLYCLGVLRKEHKSKHLSRMPSFMITGVAMAALYLQKIIQMIQTDHRPAVQPTLAQNSWPALLNYSADVTWLQYIRLHLTL